MLKSVLQKSVQLCLLPPLMLCLLLCGFRYLPDIPGLVVWSNKTLMQVYDPAAEVKLKKWELTVTDDFFLRFRKTYQNGKQEYYSVQLHDFDELDYTGNASKGTLSISTKEDDIIVQTYNDRKGNVDSMATVLSIPVKNMEPEQVDSLRNALLTFSSTAPMNAQ